MWGTHRVRNSARGQRGALLHLSFTGRLGCHLSGMSRASIASSWPCLGKEQPLEVGRLNCSWLPYSMGALCLLTDLQSLLNAQPGALHVCWAVVRPLLLLHSHRLPCAPHVNCSTELSKPPLPKIISASEAGKCDSSFSYAEQCSGCPKAAEAEGWPGKGSSERAEKWQQGTWEEERKEERKLRMGMGERVPRGRKQQAQDKRGLYRAGLFSDPYYCSWSFISNWESVSAATDSSCRAFWGGGAYNQQQGSFSPFLSSLSSFPFLFIPHFPHTSQP